MTSTVRCTLSVLVLPVLIAGAAGLPVAAQTRSAAGSSTATPPAATMPSAPAVAPAAPPATAPSQANLPPDPPVVIWEPVDPNAPRPSRPAAIAPSAAERPGAGPQAGGGGARAIPVLPVGPGTLPAGGTPGTAGGSLPPGFSGLGGMPMPSLRSRPGQGGRGGVALPPGAMPPGMMPPPPGAMPPGMLPPGAMVPGSLPPGAMPPGVLPPGAMPPGAMPPGAMPPGMRARRPPLGALPPPPVGGPSPLPGATKPAASTSSLGPAAWLLPLLLLGAGGGTFAALRLRQRRTPDGAAGPPLRK